MDKGWKSTDNAEDDGETELEELEQQKEAGDLKPVESPERGRANVAENVQKKEKECRKNKYGWAQKRASQLMEGMKFREPANSNSDRAEMACHELTGENLGEHKR